MQYTSWINIYILNFNSNFNINFLLIITVLCNAFCIKKSLKMLFCIYVTLNSIIASSKNPLQYELIQSKCFQIQTNALNNQCSEFQPYATWLNRLVQDNSLHNSSTLLPPPSPCCKVATDWPKACNCQHNCIPPKSDMDDSVVTTEQQQKAWARDGICFPDKLHFPY